MAKDWIRTRRRSVHRWTVRLRSSTQWTVSGSVTDSGRMSPSELQDPTPNIDEGKKRK